METTEIDLDAPGGELLASVAYLALLAYPESHRKRDRSVAAMLALLNRMAKKGGIPTSTFASQLFADVPHKRQGEILGHGQKGTLPRIYRRIEAAAAASRILSSRFNGGESLSLNDIAATYSGNRSYFLHTVWAESKPVLPLALGLRSSMMSLKWVDDGRPAYLQLLARLGWVREAMRSAESWHVMLTNGAQAENGPEFLRAIDPAKFLRLLPLRHSDSPTTL